MVPYFLCTQFRHSKSRMLLILPRPRYLELVSPPHCNRPGYRTSFGGTSAPWGVSASESLGTSLPCLTIVAAVADPGAVPAWLASVSVCRWPSSPLVTNRTIRQCGGPLRVEGRSGWLWGDEGCCWLPWGGEVYQGPLRVDEGRWQLLRIVDISGATSFGVHSSWPTQMASDSATHRSCAVVVVQCLGGFGIQDLRHGMPHECSCVVGVVPKARKVHPVQAAGGVAPALFGTSWDCGVAWTGGQGVDEGRWVGG